jgi:hypothetical protein
LRRYSKGRKGGRDDGGEEAEAGDDGGEAAEGEGDSGDEVCDAGEVRPVDEEVVVAAVAANAHAFITAMPQGYHSEVGRCSLTL